MTAPLTVSRRIAAAPEVVYSYLTDPDKWVRWQGSHADLDPRPGGLFLMAMPDGARARGRFLELVPDERVVFTWGWIDHPGVPPGSSVVEISIHPEDDGSMVTITHRDLPDDEIEIHRAGWEHYLPRLAAVAEGVRVEPDRGPGGQSS
ncbi:MAG TPA: SRPBCC family protein [Acidimicrobiia bacterium]|nr:SRPBCC family protein [Acidimicrobiia bacterium]